MIFAKFYAAQEQKRKLDAEREVKAKLEAEAKEARAAAKAAAKAQRQAADAKAAETQAEKERAAKLSSCPACGGMVAVGAKACPHCGRDNPAPAPQKSKKSIVWAVVVLIAVAWVATSKSPSSSTPAVGRYERCPAIDPATLWLPKGHEAARDDFIAKAYWLNTNGQCVLDGSYGEQTRKYYFSVRPLGEKNAKHMRFTRDELRP